MLVDSYEGTPYRHLACHLLRVLDDLNLGLVCLESIWDKINVSVTLGLDGFYLH